ncbi:MAG: hypothetical protein KDD44_04245 [Bdellovibrionales bacterium]|nr:hypothetical protein [Bdellovibrionales bacterium]
MNTIIHHFFRGIATFSAGCVVTCGIAIAQPVGQATTDETSVDATGRCVGEVTTSDNINSGFDDAKAKATEKACMKICEGRKPKSSCTVTGVTNTASDPNPDDSSWKLNKIQGRYTARREGAWSCTCQFDCPKTGGTADLYPSADPASTTSGPALSDTELEDLLLLYSLEQ